MATPSAGASGFFVVRDAMSHLRSRPDGSVYSIVCSLTQRVDATSVFDVITERMGSHDALADAVSASAHDALAASPRARERRDILVADPNLARSFTVRES
eukprot:4839297-Prymnesium_polylepis.2